MTAIEVRRFTRHLPGCDMLASHQKHELVCTCGRDAALDDLEALVDAAEGVFGYIEDRHKVGGVDEGPSVRRLADAIARVLGEEQP